MGNAAVKTADETWVYAFGGGTSDGDASMRNLLGGKGANLAEMAQIGLPVPPGFTITTEESVRYLNEGQAFSDKLRADVLINELRYRHESDATPMREGLAEIPQRIGADARRENGHIDSAPLRINVIEEDFWDLSEVLY